jgi:hypothetical protein
MSQERFNGLAILCIEKYMIEHFNVDTIISDFVFGNVRRDYFMSFGYKIKKFNIF